jgi:transcriptional regulator with XRE-family HTH domain
MTPTSREVGARIRARRIEKDLSQEALAKKAALSREHVARLEAGLYEPTLGTLERLARALGLSLPELLK